MEIIKLWEKEDIPFFEENFKQNEPYIEAYIKENAKSAIVVCPGGGYGAIMDHEGAWIAPWINSIGLSAFILHYRVEPHKYPCAQIDAQRAVRIVRKLSEKYGYDPDKIGIMGASAGAHAAGCVAFMPDSFGEKLDDTDEISSKVNYALLMYPVVSMAEYSHPGSVQRLLGDNPSPELLEKLTLSNSVTPDAPPVFMWHTADDKVVPMENSLMLAAALCKNKVPVAYHCFESGAHGLSLSKDNPDVAQWKELFVNWLKNHNMI